jgi:hypothetical protein
MTELTLTLEQSQLEPFNDLFQRGFTVPAVTGCSLSSFLTEQMQIDPGYVKERITTIFLDGDVVDSPEAAIIQDGSRIALSASMPGVAGATMRRGGAYSPMRRAITRATEAALAAAGRGPAPLVKLFNPPRELGKTPSSADRARAARDVEASAARAGLTAAAVGAGVAAREGS